MKSEGDGDWRCEVNHRNLTHADCDRLLRWLMEDEPVELHRRPYRWLDIGLFVVIVGIIVTLALAGCSAPRPPGWSDPNAVVTVAPDGTMALCTTVRVLPAGPE